MKAAARMDSRSVPNWERDLAKLKQLRHMRNQLAHEEGAFEEVHCGSDDIDWLQDFRSRILNRTDPMALLRQNVEARQQTARQPYTGLQVTQVGAPAPHRQNKRPGWSPWAKFWAVVLILSAVALCCCVIWLLTASL